METYCTFSLDTIPADVQKLSNSTCAEYRTTGKGSPLIALIRNSDTDENLYYYNVTPDTTGTSLVPDLSQFVHSIGKYDVTLRPWYIGGKSCGQRANSTYGQFCMGEIYRFRTSLLLSFVQPFYSSDGVFRGILSIDLALPDVQLQAYIQSLLPTEESEIAIVQDKGMLLLAGLLDSLYHLHLVVKAR